MRVSSFLALATVSTALASPAWNPFTSEDGPVKTTDSWSWTDCGLPGDVAEITSLEVFPDPPQPGQDLTIKAKGYVHEKVEDGAYADVLVKLGVIKLINKRFDVCEEAEKAEVELQCPVEEGEHTVTHTVALPKEIPKAKFLVQVRAFTVDDDPMLCADIKIDFMKRPF